MWEAILAGASPALKWIAGLGCIGAIIGGLALIRRWIRQGATAETKAKEAEAREKHHEEAEQELHKPAPSGPGAILARRKARRLRRERFGA